MILTPSEQVIFDKKVQDVTQGMLNNKRALVAKFGGKKAGEIIQGRAVNMAKKEIEKLRKNQEMENNKLKEAVRAALMNEKKKPFPDLTGDGKVTKADILKGRGVELDEDLDSGHKDNKPHMLKAALTKPLKEQDVEVRADKEKETQASLIMNNLIDLLQDHDWYYMMSDDYRAYDRGSNKEREINRLMKDLENLGFSDDAKSIYNEYAPENMSLTEDLDLGHEDNEPHMLKADLYKIGKYAMELYQIMDQFEGKGEVDLPAWWQNKINTAKNMISSAKHYLEFELKEPQIDAMVGVAQSEDMTNMNEKKLTKPEIKKSEEIAKAIEKEDPEIDKGYKIAIARKLAKKVAEGLAKKLKK